MRRMLGGGECMGVGRLGGAYTEKRRRHREKMKRRVRREVDSTLVTLTLRRMRR